MDAKLRILVVDDEPLARQRVSRMLAGRGDVELVGECGSAKEALTIVEQEKPDLLLLDVQMPEEDGFSLLRRIDPKERPAVVFVTAFDQYAVEAFQVHALDYVLKPVEAERLNEAIDRAHQQIAGADPVGLDRRLRELLAELSPRGRYLDRILVRNPGRISFVNTDEIYWIGAEGNYVRLHLAKERPLVRQKISALEERLDPKRFLRIHRSAIVSLDHVRELTRMPGGDYSVQLDSGARLTLSRSYKERFEAAVGRGVDELD